jgi:hypothetical protein
MEVPRKQINEIKTMTRQQAIETQIEEIMDEFDFGLCHKAFVDNRWTYSRDTEPPSLGELRKTARRLLRDCARTPGGNTLLSGRFEARTIEDTEEKWLRMSLTFVYEFWNIDEGTEYE